MSVEYPRALRILAPYLLVSQRTLLVYYLVVQTAGVNYAVNKKLFLVRFWWLIHDSTLHQIVHAKHL